MKLVHTSLAGLVIVEPIVHADARGFFMETYHEEKFAAVGITTAFVQDNHSHSVKNVVRGLKFQFDKPADKLVRVAYGAVYAVGVDLRPDSPTFGTWESVELSAENKRMLYLPFGFAFGFCVTSEAAGVLYKLSALHNDKGAGTIRWNDPDLAIPWPTKDPILAPGDVAAPTLKEWIASGGKEHMVRKHDL